MQTQSSGQARRPAALIGIGPDAAAPLGTTVKSRIERGDPYSIPRVYQLEITVLEVARGEAAREKLRRESSGQSPSLKEGMEPLLARLRLGFFSRRGGVVEKEELKLDKERFLAASGDGTRQYEIPEFQPQPALVGQVLAPGQQVEGWLLLEVPKEEARPLLVFRREQTEGIYGLFGQLWLALH